MINSPKFLNALDWTVHTVQFFKRHFWVIFSLGLVAAFGRAVQLKAFGPISPTSNLLLEVIVESARVLIFIYTLGFTQVKTGIILLLRFVTNQQSRKRYGCLAIQKIRNEWPAVLLNLLVFSAIAFLLNGLINHIAYETCLYITLKTRQIIADQASEWAIILFLKNLSVIPFTLVFNALFCLWLANRIPRPVAYR